MTEVNWVDARHQWQIDQGKENWVLDLPYDIRIQIHNASQEWPGEWTILGGMLFWSPVLDLPATEPGELAKAKAIAALRARCESVLRVTSALAHPVVEDGRTSERSAGARQQR